MKQDESKNKIVVNSKMWQSEAWTRLIDNVLSEDEIHGVTAFPSPLAISWRIFRKRKYADVVSTQGINEAVYYGLLCTILPWKCPPWVVREIFLNPPNIKKFRSRLWDLARRCALKKADLIVVNSYQEVKTYSDWLGLPVVRFRYVPFHTNIINPTQCEPGDYGLAAGRSGRDWGTFFKAIESLIYPFKVVADKSSIRGFRIPSNVTLLCDIPREQYYDVVRKSAFVIVPLKKLHRSTGQVVILDAYSFGKPVIATRTGGTSDYLLENHTGIFCEPDSEDSLREAIIQLVDNKERAFKMGKQGFKYVINNHSFQVHVENLLKVLNEAIKCKNK